MYCRQCGTQLSDSARFCHNCGTPQTEAVLQMQNEKQGNGCLVAIVICVVIALLVCLAMLMVPRDGWYEEKGKRYFYDEGEVITGLNEIGEELYYFDENGVLAVDKDVVVDGNTFEANPDGQITAVTVAYIDGEWSSEKYQYDTYGESSIKVLNMEVTNCDCTGFYIESSGQYGATTTCNWKIYVRSHGEWVFAKEVYFTEPSGTFFIKFDYPMDFDAITAYPTIQGNASYVNYFALVDVHMGL